MLNLIESIVMRTNARQWPAYDTICNQVIGYLMRSNKEYKKYPYEWFTALLSVLNSTTKFRLMGDLLTLARNLLGVGACGTLIKAGLDTIYPASVRSSVWSETKPDNERDNHAYIAYDHTRFARIISKWSRELRGDVNFIDVGCGIGDKLLMARYFVDRIKSITGVEINAHTYNLGEFFTKQVRKWLNTPFTVIEGDAFDIDYEEYNLIYMFRPIAGNKRMCELYKHILETMPVDGMMIEVMSMHEDDMKERVPVIENKKRFEVENTDHHLIVKKIA